MKLKITIIILLISSAIAAQTNIQLHYDFGENRKFFTSTIERFKPDDYGNLFYFIDFNHSIAGPTEAYIEIARELQFWDAPFLAHIEYNGGVHADDTGLNFQIKNAYLLGGTYSLNNQNFTKGISLSAMYKLIQGNTSPHSYQLTIVWYMHFLNKKLSFNGFSDFWREVNSFININHIFLSEPQLWYNITNRFSIGGEIEFGYNFGNVKGWNICPTLGVKCNL